eukprot:CAMPEP_0206427142 /NCGR_PEP_ID=MMETSP0324_2-20121206/4844_1 /ASSEMBLY_ACC=CAM_ASM_000836 /TAXON_ID=2866 /ORGANISM="Crypthecodinium cohnii, Strain Seligo" /LENGTH=400 /DNA_ID=CAMNT_0053892325 /DNA_START=192 /DNA_END=1394 /DNA_ORIENTATION=-
MMMPMMNSGGNHDSYSAAGSNHQMWATTTYGSYGSQDPCQNQNLHQNQANLNQNQANLAAMGLGGTCPATCAVVCCSMTGVWGFVPVYAAPMQHQQPQQISQFPQAMAGQKEMPISVTTNSVSPPGTMTAAAVAAAAASATSMSSLPSATAATSSSPPSSFPGAPFSPANLSAAGNSSDSQLCSEVSSSPTRKTRILCYGDSLTVGFCSGGRVLEPYGRAMSEQLIAAGLEVDIEVCGLSGRTAQEMVTSMQGSLIDVIGLQGKGLARALAEDGPYDLVVIMAGTNDMAFGSGGDSLLSNLYQLHSICHSHGTPTVALAPPPAPGKGREREIARFELAERLKGMASSMPGVAACMDTSELMPPADMTLWDSDGLHFSPAGSCAFGRGLANVALNLVTARG